MKKTLSRMLSVFLSLCMLTTLVPTAMAASGSDIAGHWAQANLQKFIDNGWLAGYGDGRYGPDDAMTRAQYATLLNQVMGLTEESGAIANYTDAAPEDWFYSQLAKALAAGYMTGTSATTLSPNEPITREQSFVMVANLLGLTATDAQIEALSRFEDHDQISDYAKSAIAALLAAGYVAGTGDGKLAPKREMTRAEGITVLCNAQGALQGAAGGALTDGEYTGTGAGYGGTITVKMTVSGGKITAIEVTSHSETYSYYNRAKGILDSVLAAQTTEGVDTISGATRTSSGLLTAINACISQAQGGADTSKTGSTGGGGGGGAASRPDDSTDISGRLKDGVYTGTASGYSNAGVTVRVTVSDGKITDIQVTNNGETASYFNMTSEGGTAGGKITAQIIANQSAAGIDTVSGATYSSYGIINAVKNALADAESTAAVTFKVSTWKELTAALAAAAAGDTVQLTADITDAGNIDGVSSATATINKAVTVDGQSHTITASQEKVAGSDGEKKNATFCFEVTGAQGITIKDLTIDGASFSAKLGGAMYVETGAELTLNGVTFQNCKAGNTGDGNGGAAIYAEPHRGTAPTVTAIGCTFRDNTVNDGTTGRGGAVYAYNADLVLQNCTFSGNKAGYGGAVAAAGSANLTVTGCTFESSNDGAFGGDDIYIFDGLSFYKKTMYTDSAVSYAISGNAHRGTDGSTFKEYRVAVGRVLGTVVTYEDAGAGTVTRYYKPGDTIGESGTETGYKAVEYTGSGNSAFLPGKDLTFDITAEDGRARKTEGVTPPATEYKYVLMNIPYAEFYAAETADNDVPVDAFTSATINKTRTGTLAGGSYHELTYVGGDPGGEIESSKIVGVTFPVVMTAADFAVLEGKGYTVVKDSDSVTISVTNRGQPSVTTYSGREALFEKDSYSYYVLDAAPDYYKVASYQDGALVFGGAQGVRQSLTGVTASFTTESGYGDYELDLIGVEAFDHDTDKIYGVVLNTTDGTGYGLRHLENIWLGVELAWCTGFTDTVHGCATSSEHYESMMGKTIDTVTYFTSKGIYIIDLEDIRVPVKFEGGVTVGDPAADAKTTAMTMEGFPNNYQPVYTVANAAGEDVTGTYGFACTGTVLSWTGTPPVGNYTLTVSDDGGMYAPYSDTFVLATATNPVAYNAEMRALTADSGNGFDAGDLAAYLSAISTVQVGEHSYSASGRNAVTIFNESGFLDLTAQSGGGYVFAEMTPGTVYSVTVTATGYSAPLTFALIIPDTVYAYAALTYAEYWAGESVFLAASAAGDYAAASDQTDSNGEADLGAFDAVSRATTNHGWHRGSFQQIATIRCADGTELSVAYWNSSSELVLTDGTVVTVTNRTTLTYQSEGKTVTKTYASCQLSGVKYVPVAVPAASYQAFCTAYSVTQNGETLAGGYSENNLTAYSETAYVTADTNGLKEAGFDSAWSFGARKTGTGSGVLGKELQNAAGITYGAVASSRYGDFIRVDLKGNYGALGSAMQTVEWKYYGTDENRVEPLAAFGTKFAADNWMHKSNGIQLGLTESLRCQLPEGTNGTGKWEITVCALGFADYTVTVNVTADDLHGDSSPMTTAQKTTLQSLAGRAAALIPDPYVEGEASQAMKNLYEHYIEAAALLENSAATQAQADELIGELPDLIAAVQTPLADGVWYGTATEGENYDRYGYGPSVVKVTVESGVIKEAEFAKYNDDSQYQFGGTGVLNHVVGLSSLGGIEAQLNGKSGTVYDAVSGATVTAKGTVTALNDALSRARRYAGNGTDQVIAWMEFKTRPTTPAYYNEALDLSGTTLTLHLIDGTSREAVFSGLSAYGITCNVANGTIFTAQDGSSIKVEFTHALSGAHVHSTVALQTRITYRYPSHILVTYTDQSTEQIDVNNKDFAYELEMEKAISKVELYDGSTKLADGELDYGDWYMEINTTEHPAGENAQWRYTSFRLGPTDNSGLA